MSYDVASFVFKKWGSEMVSIRHRMIKGIPTLELTEEGQENAVLPIIFFYHGWQSEKELVLTQGRKLVKKGFRVILPDSKNHGERKYQVNAIPSLTFWDTIQANIAEFGMLEQFYQDRDLIKEGQIGVGGYSMGAMTTGALLTHHPEIKAATIIMGTPSLISYAKLVRDHAKRNNIYVPNDLEDLTSWIKHYDLDTNIETLKNRPLLFWHGTEDERIPYSQSWDFYQKYKDNPNASQTAFITGYKAGHLVETRLMDKIANFFEYYVQ